MSPSSKVWKLMAVDGFWRRMLCTYSGAGTESTDSVLE